MKIIQISTNISKMPDEQIHTELLSFPPTSDAISLINESIKRRDIKSFLIISTNPKYVNHIEIAKNILNTIEKNPNHSDIIQILINFMYYADTSIISDNHKKLLSMAVSFPHLMPIIFLSNQSTQSLIHGIINTLQLNIVRKTILDNNDYLQSIIKELEQGTIWENTYSGIIMISRLSQNPRDKFITEISKYDLHPLIASTLYNAAKTLKNEELETNLKNNQHPGTKLSGLYLLPKDHPLHSIVPALIEIITSTQNTQYMHLIWEYIKNRTLENKEWQKQIFTLYYVGKNVILSILDEYPDYFCQVIDLLKQIPDISEIRTTPAYAEIIKRGLDNPSYKEKILDLPPHYFTSVDLSKEHYEILYKYFHPEVEEYKSLEEILGNQNDFLIQYSDAKELLKEAGWKENLMTSLIAAILSVFGGSTIYNAAQKYNIKEETLKDAMHNQELLIKARELQILKEMRRQQEQQIQKQPKQQTKPTQQAPKILPKTPKLNISKTNIDDIVGIIMEHENLLPKQTPFRITHPSMKKWNNIHGFEVDKSYPRPKGREKFIFLKNPDDVPKAIKKQFIEYQKNPSNYGLPHQPSLRDALRVFDQTGVRGKINYILDRIPKININQPLAYFFS